MSFLINLFHVRPAPVVKTEREWTPNTKKENNSSQPKAGPVNNAESAVSNNPDQDLTLEMDDFAMDDLEGI